MEDLDVMNASMTATFDSGLTGDQGLHSGCASEPGRCAECAEKYR